MTEERNTENEADRNEVGERLRRLEEHYGFVPFVAQALSEKPDLFLPYSDLSKRLLLEPKHLTLREMELSAVAASAALASEHCLGVHIPEALKVGASKDEILEAIMVGSFMAMTRSQSVAIRKLKDIE